LPTWDGFLERYIEFCKGLSHQYRGYAIDKIMEQDLLDDASAERQRNPVRVATVLKSKLMDLPQNIRTNVENDFKRWFFGLFAAAKPNKKHELLTSTEYPYILTSNYDLLLEDAAKAIGSPYSSLSFFQSKRPNRDVLPQHLNDR